MSQEKMRKDAFGFLSLPSLAAGASLVLGDIGGVWREEI
jgi:hypothetical protein